MLKSYLHEFHFILDTGMKEELKNLSIYKELGSLSGIIVKILWLIGLVIRREHKWGEQRESRYMPVCDNPDELREHVHVYFPRELYRELKLLHADLNCFSIAQLVREFLRIFLDLVKEFGNNVFMELERMFKVWNEEIDKTRLTPRGYIRQLWKVIQHLPGKNRLVNMYNGQFSPFWIFRL